MFFWVNKRFTSVCAMADEPTESESRTTDPSSPDLPDEVEGSEGSETPAASKAKPAKTGDASTPTVKRKVVSKRVTPKGGVQAKPTGRSTKGSTAAHAHAADGDDASYSTRYTPPTAKYAAGPSPWWVPALMFGLLIVGALVIMLNYMGVFGDADNVRLIIGLAFILGGIITATQLR